MLLRNVKLRSVGHSNQKFQPKINFGKRLNKLIEQIPSCESGQIPSTFSEINYVPKNILKSLKKPCINIQYYGTTQIQLQPENPNKATFKYRFSHPPEVEVNEEYIIVDLVGIISSIGGTLGIVIGSSIYDLIKFINRKISNKMKTTKNTIN